MLVDTHCHLDLEPLAGVVAAVLDRARAAGVRRCVSIGTTVASSRANVELARQHPMVRAGIGVHPDAADTVTEDALAAIESLSREPSVAAIGEIGLDDYRNPIPLPAQVRALRGLLAIAQRRELPILIHCRGRDAYGALLDVLRDDASRGLRGVLHCASGSPAFIRDILELGLHVSFAGNVTFPNARALRELVPLVPDDRLLVETDAPFLAPQPVRGQVNEPAHVTHTAAHLAQLRGMTAEDLSALTTENASRLFRLSNQ